MEKTSSFCFERFKRERERERENICLHFRVSVVGGWSILLTQQQISQLSLCNSTGNILVLR